MKCSKCGFEYDEGLFCPECGTQNIDTNGNIPEQENELVKNRLEQERIAKERVEKEAELAKIRLQQELLEKEKREEENAKKVQAEQQRIESANHEEQMAKNRLEQERIAKEKVEKEAELAKIKLQQELLEKEKREKEIASRNAKKDEKQRIKEEKKSNPKHLAVYSIVIGIITWLLTFTGVGAILAILTTIIGIVLGIMALKSTQKGKAIGGIIINASWWALAVIGIVLSIIIK